MAGATLVWGLVVKPYTLHPCTVGALATLAPELRLRLRAAHSAPSSLDGQLWRVPFVLAVVFAAWILLTGPVHIRPLTGGLL